MSLIRSFGIGIAGVAAIGAYWHVLSADVSRPAVRALAESGKIESVTSNPSQQPRPVFEPKPGFRYTYHFKRLISIDGLASGKVVASYEGKLFLDILSESSSGFDALLSAELLQHPQSNSFNIRLHCVPDGTTVSLQAPPFHNQDDRQQLGILKDLVSLWVFPLQSDTVGEYRGIFKTLNPSPEGFPRVHKSKITYIKTYGALKPTIVSSLNLLEWDSQEKVPHRILGNESTRLGTDQLKFSSESSYEFDFLSRTPHQNAAQETRFHPESLSLSPDPTSRGRSRFSAADWPILRQRLSQISKLSSSEQLQLFSDLANFLKNHGDALSDLMSQLSESAIAMGPASSVFKTVVGALATAGTPQTQAALIGIYRDPGCPVSGKGTILSALTTTQAPLTPETRDFLLGESQNSSDPDLASGAAWALGSSLQNAPSDPSSDRAIAALQQDWAAASSQNSEAQQLDVLDAIGNSGKSDFLPILTGVIDTTTNDEALRAKAVYALRFIQTPNATSLLAGKLSDSDPSIRLAAANAIQVAPWDASYQAPLQNCAASDPVSGVQNACQTALKNHSVE